MSGRLIGMTDAGGIVSLDDPEAIADQVAAHA
jgi:hypothetical protein